jgi:hypothetical protein
MADRDSPWKEVLDDQLRPALEFLFAEVVEDIDWQHDPESLEQELRKLAPEGETGKRIADKLVKFRSLTGDDRYLHVEVQGKPEDDFPRRVYVYSYRAEDRFGVPVESLIILADEDPKWRPTTYRVQLKRMQLTFEFKPVKLLDWVHRKEELAQHPNPMGLFVLAHLESLRTRGDPEERARVKLGLIQLMAERKLEAEEARRWYPYLDWFLDLPAALERQIWQQVAELEQEKLMPFVTFAERYGHEKGLRKGLLTGLAAVLEVKFGAQGLELMAALRQIEEVERLEAILQAAKQPTASLDELRRSLSLNAPPDGTAS